MQHIGERKQPSILNLAIIVVLVVALVVYFIIASATGDWLWFSGAFREPPTRLYFTVMVKPPISIQVLFITLK